MFRKYIEDIIADVSPTDKQIKDVVLDIIAEIFKELEKREKRDSVLEPPIWDSTVFCRLYLTQSVRNVFSSEVKKVEGLINDKINSAEFMDDLVDRINRKQLKK